MVSLGTTIQGYVGIYEWHYMINGSYFCFAFLLNFFPLAFQLYYVANAPKFFKKLSLTFT
jgi:hypothetical protein